MNYFLIGESSVSGSPLYVLWTRDASKVRVLRWGSRDRRDMQALGRGLAGAARPQLDLTRPEAMAVGAAYARGRHLELVELGAGMRVRIAAEIVRTSGVAADGDRGAAAHERTSSHL